MAKRIKKTFHIIADDRTITVTGRECFALEHLIRAGARGITALEAPAIRWAAYVFDLRNDFGLAIETRHEAHKGDFPGSHARYVLHTQVELVAEERAAA